MGLDYTSGCVNFRDVGEFVNLIARERLLPEKRLFRGGKLDHVASLETVKSPKTIINLRKGPDPDFFGLPVRHFPISNDYEKYQAQDKVVRRWLRGVMAAFADPLLQYPVLVHCTSGKDRTGVVVAGLLKVLGVPERIIVEEYLLSDGEVREEWIRQALAGIGTPETYFDGVDLGAIRRNILD